MRDLHRRVVDVKEAARYVGDVPEHHAKNQPQSGVGEDDADCEAPGYTR